jgi:hypothetical protein
LKSVLLLLFPVLVNAQQRIATANWQFTIGSYSTVVSVAQTSPTEFQGTFTGSGILAFKGQLTPSGNATAITLRWDPTLLLRAPDPVSAVPGLSSGLSYYGTLGADGCSLTGTYGAMPSQSVGVWSAIVTAGSYLTAVPPCGSQTLPVKAPTPSCDNTTLSGSFAYQFSGFVVFPTAGLMPIASTGRMVVDGAGNLTATSTASVNGAISRGTPLKGTYSVNSDCTGNLQFTDSTGMTPLSQLDMVVTSSGKTIQLIETDGATVVTGTAVQQ